MFSLRTVLHWLWLRKECLRLGFRFRVWRSILPHMNRIEENLKLFEYASKAVGPVVEVGSYIGESAFCLSEGSWLGCRQMVYSVDSHCGGVVGDGNCYPRSLEAFYENIARSRGWHLVAPVLSNSPGCSLFWRQPVGFLFVDADHSFEAVKADFVAWSRFVVVGGVVAFHDASFGGVRRFLEEVLSRDARFVFVERVFELAFFRRVG